MEVAQATPQFYTLHFTFYISPLLRFPNYRPAPRITASAASASRNSEYYSKKPRFTGRGFAKFTTAESRYNYGTDDKKATLLIRVISTESSFVNAKHFLPRSFSDAPMR